MRTCSVAAFAVLLAVLSAPVAANAQSLMLTSDRSCYGAGQLIELTGYGFTPDGDVALSAGGQQLGIGVADYDGVFAASMRAPAFPFWEVGLRFTATDRTYLLNRASTLVRLTSLGVVVTPTTGTPARPRQIRARGFFGGRMLYAHIRSATGTHNVRIGRLRGACHVLSVTRRLFHPSVRAGAYRISFDTDRHYFRRAGARVTYAVTIARRASRASAATAAVGERWSRLP